MSNNYVVRLLLTVGLLVVFVMMLPVDPNKRTTAVGLVAALVFGATSGYVIERFAGWVADRIVPRGE